MVVFLTDSTTHVNAQNPYFVCKLSKLLLFTPERGGVWGNVMKRLYSRYLKQFVLSKRVEGNK